MSGRPFTRADYLALKSATRRAVEEAGPLHALSQHTRADPALLSRYGNPDRPEYVPLDVAIDLIALSGGSGLLRTIAELCGYDLVERDPLGNAASDMIRHISQMGRAAAELQSSMCDAAEDGVITPRESSEIETKSADVIDADEHLQRDMRRVRAGGA